MARGVMRTMWARVVVMACLVATFLVVGPSGTGLGASMAAASPVGTVTYFTANSIGTPAGITTGPDGNVWFTASNSIGRITTLGAVSVFAVPGIGNAAGITAGPDGNLWFATGANSIGRITPAGVVSTFTDPSIADPHGIAAGPDGNLWFTNNAWGQDSIGRITPAGVVSHFTDPIISYPIGITAGPDGNLWFTNGRTNTIGRITPAGVVSQFTDPSISYPIGITAGPDGNLWFTNESTNTIGRVTPVGVVSHFTDPTITNPSGIAAGADGNLWFTNTDPVHGHNSIGRITTAGVVTNFPDPTINNPAEITAGPDGNLWFTNQGSGTIGRIVSGVVATPGATGEFTPLTPARILDTRDGTGGHSGPLGGGGSFDVQVAGQGGVPASGVGAVVLNATVTEPSAPGFLTIWPTGVAQPVISNLNFVPGQTVPNAVTVAVGAGGKVSVFNHAGTTHVVFDVVGYYSNAAGPSGSRFHGISPVRQFDTRNGTGGVPVAPVGQNATLKFKVTGKDGVPASGVSGVVMNVTVTDPTTASYVTVYPDDVARPLASNLNFVGGQTVPNLVVMRVPASGIVDFYNLSGSTNLLADVVGYYDGDKSTEAGRLIPLTPSRQLDTRDLGEPLPPDSGGVLQITGYGGVPVSEVSSVVLNVTVTQPSDPGFVTVFPDDDCSIPLASNLNFVAGQTVPNLVMVRVSTLSGCAVSAGAIDFYNHTGYTHLIADVFAYFT